MSDQRPYTDDKHPDGPSDHAPRVSDAPPAYPISAPIASLSFPTDTKTSIPRLPQYGCPPQPGFGAGSSLRTPSTYAAVSLAWDKTRIIGFPKDVVEPLDAAVRRVWTPGVKEFKAVDEICWYWKLVGWPWSSFGAATTHARRMVAHVLHALAEKGWHLAVSTDLCRPGTVKDTLIFKLGTPSQRYIFSICLQSWDKIRIIDPPHDGVRVAFELAVRGAWPLGIQGAKEDEPGCWQLKLKGTPWSTLSGDQFNQSRLVMMAVLSAMEVQGYDLLGRVAMTSGSEDTTGLDTWFFVQA